MMMDKKRRRLKKYKKNRSYTQRKICLNQWAWGPWEWGHGQTIILGNF
jgi:hypothetical protein